MGPFLIFKCAENARIIRGKYALRWRVFSAHSPRILRVFSAHSPRARKMRGKYAENAREYAWFPPGLSVYRYIVTPSCSYSRFFVITHSCTCTSCKIPTDKLWDTESRDFPEVYWTENKRFWQFFVSFPDSFEECLKRIHCSTQIHFSTKKIFWRNISGVERLLWQYLLPESQEDVIHSHVCSGFT